MRTVEMDKWTVSLYETPHVDHHGKSGIRVTVHEGEVLVYDTGAQPGGLVYVPSGQTVDGDRSVFSAIALCCHDATHDSDEEPRDAGWDAEGLSEMAACQECDS